jgi:hypothetical protein
MDVIYAYTRAQALADGVLIDVTDTAREAGIRHPTALSRAVWERCVRVPQGLADQDETGRRWDLLWLVRLAMLESPNWTCTEFQLLVRNRADGLDRVILKVLCGPGDDLEPVLTVLLSRQED